MLLTGGFTQNLLKQILTFGRAFRTFMSPLWQNQQWSHTEKCLLFHHMVLQCLFIILYHISNLLCDGFLLTSWHFGTILFNLMVSSAANSKKTWTFELSAWLISGFSGFLQHSKDMRAEWRLHCQQVRWVFVLSFTKCQLGLNQAPFKIIGKQWQPGSFTNSVSQLIVQSPQNRDSVKISTVKGAFCTT